MYIARFRPELNKQVQSLYLTLFPMGTGILHNRHSLNPLCRCLNLRTLSVCRLLNSNNDKIDKKR